MERMRTFDKPNNDIVVDNKWFYPFTSYLYIFNLITMYKAEILTRNRLQDLLECPDWVLDNVDYNLKDIESAVYAVIDWDIDKE